MANYPTSLDTLTNPAATDPLDAPPHHTQHSDANDILEELEAKIGLGTSDALSAGDGYVLTADGAGGSGWAPGAPSFVGARYIRTAALSVTDNVDFRVTLATDTSFEYDTDGSATSGVFYDSGVDAYRFTAPMDGVYSVGMNIRFEANATGSRQCWIKRTLVSNAGATSVHGRVADHAPDGTIPSYLDTEADFYLFAGDYVEFYVRQNSGGALNLAIMDELPSFWIKLNKGAKGDTGTSDFGVAGDIGASAPADAAAAGATGLTADAGHKHPRLNETFALAFVIDGGGSTITTGIKGDIYCPFAFTIQEWTLLADQSGAIVIDVWKDTYANYPPTDADAMPGAGKEPTITASGTKAQDTSITDWTSDDVAAGSTLRFNVDSVTSIQRVTLVFKCVRT